MNDPAHLGIQTRYLDHRKQEQESPAATIQAVAEILGRGAHAARDHRHDTIRITKAAGRPIGYFPRSNGTTTIVTPGHCVLPEGKTWGWSIQLYALRSSSSWGMGDFGDLARFARWAKDLGADMVMVNPLSAGIPANPQQPSPYFPSSRGYLDPLYLCIDEVEGAERAAEHLSDLREPALSLNSSSLIERDQIFDLKMAALQRIWQGFETDQRFERFRSERGRSLTDHATFACLVEDLGRGWRQWPARFTDPRNDAVTEFRNANRKRVAFHEWVQWQASLQLEKVREILRVVQDIAVGVDPEGCDAWMWQNVYVEGVTVGAPPDRFNTRGQDWGLPPFDPWALRGAAYEPFIELLRGAMAGGAVRIDHVMGLFRLWWIPESAGPSEGVYVTYPSAEMLDIVSLESHRNGAYVIGEDLGTVGPGVREELSARGMLSYRLLLFLGPQPSRFPRLSLGAVTTHDLPTIAGLWTGSDLEEQRALDLAPNEEETRSTREVLETLIGPQRHGDLQGIAVPVYKTLASFDSAVVAVTMEDAVGVEARPNVPGTLTERPNWRIPLPLTLEQIQQDSGVLRLAEEMAASRPASPRRGLT